MNASRTCFVHNTRDASWLMFKRGLLQISERINTVNRQREEQYDTRSCDAEKSGRSVATRMREETSCRKGSSGERVRVSGLERSLYVATSFV